MNYRQIKNKYNKNNFLPVFSCCDQVHWHPKKTIYFNGWQDSCNR